MKDLSAKIAEKLNADYEIEIVKDGRLLSSNYFGVLIKKLWHLFTLSSKAFIPGTEL